MLSQEVAPDGIRKTVKSQFNQYHYIADENPEQVIRQRIPGRIGGNRASFSVRPFKPNLLLSSKAYIKWTFSMTKKKNEAPPVDEDFGLEDQTGGSKGEIIVMKPFMCMANATTSIKLTINGRGTVYNEPRYWQKYFGQLFCPNDALEKYFSTSGGFFPLSKGAYVVEDGFVDHENGTGGDDNLDRSADATFLNYAAEAENAPTATVDFYEPLYVGVFNWAYDIKDTLPENCWNKKMSNLIPYVRSMNYDIEFDNITANCFHYFYGRTSGGFESLDLTNNGLLSGELILEWVRPKQLHIIPPNLKGQPFNSTAYPGIHGIANDQVDFSIDSMEIPDEVKLQSWYLDHRQFPINPVIAATPPILIDNVPTSLSIPEFHTYQIPSMFLMFATRDKSAASYICRSVLFSDDNGANEGISADINSMENNCELTSINIQINTDKDRVDSRFNSRELYNLTLKNAKKDFPYDFSKYIGGNSRQASYPCNMCVLLTPDDLNIDKTTGRMSRSFVFKAAIDILPKGGHWIRDAGENPDYVYRFHLIFLYDKYYMKINKKGIVDYRYESVF